METTQRQEITKMYDYIFAVTKKQNKLLPIGILYGDGSRWNNNFSLFYATYQALKQIIKDRNLCPVID